MVGRTGSRAAAVDALQARLGWRFADDALLERALTHASVGDGARAVADNELLEFLGDRVLGLLIAERLTAEAPEASEGDLAPRLNLLVSRAACARVARDVGLGEALRLSAAETRGGGRDKESILAGACEAVLAAVYREGGLEAARGVVSALWREGLEGEPSASDKDVKTRLQEWAQGAGRPLPTYQVTARSGPQHAPRFTVQVSVAGVEVACGQGPSRRAAEKAAAAALLEREGVA